MTLPCSAMLCHALPFEACWRHWPGAQEAHPSTSRHIGRIRRSDLLASWGGRAEVNDRSLIDHVNLNVRSPGISQSWASSVSLSGGSNLASWRRRLLPGDFPHPKTKGNRLPSAQGWRIEDVQRLGGISISNRASLAPWRFVQSMAEQMQSIERAFNPIEAQLSIHSACEHAQAGSRSACCQRWTSRRASMLVRSGAQV